MLSALADDLNRLLIVLCGELRLAKQFTLDLTERYRARRNDVPTSLSGRSLEVLMGWERLGLTMEFAVLLSDGAHERVRGLT